MSSQGFVFLLLTWIIWKKKFCRRTSLETTCFWCFFCCNLKKIRCTGGVFVRLWGFCTIHCFYCQVGYMKRVLSLFGCLKHPAVSGWGGWRRGRRRRRSRRHEGPDYQSETQYGDVAVMNLWCVWIQKHVGIYSVWVHSFDYKTYQQLGFLCKRWKLNTCTGFRLVVLLKWDVLTKEIGVPPQKKGVQKRIRRCYGKR